MKILINLGFISREVMGFGIILKYDVIRNWVICCEENKERKIENEWFKF